MRRGTHLIVGGLLVSLLVPFAGASTAPQHACAPCGYGFEYAADVSVERSAVLISLDHDGSASWTVRNEVGQDDAQALRNHANLTAVAVKAVRSRGLPGYRGTDAGLRPAENISAEVVNETVVIRFDHPDAAKRINDVLLLRYFRVVWEGISLNAETFSVVGPPGTTIANDRAVRIDEVGVRTTVDDRRFTWYTESGRHQTFYRRTYVAFASTSDPLAGVKTRLAIGRAIAPTVVTNFLYFVAPQAALFAVALLGIVTGVRRTSVSEPDSDTQILLGAIGVVTVIGLGSALATSLTDPVTAVLLVIVLVTLYGTIALLGWSGRTRGRLDRPSRQALGALLATAVTVTVAAVLLVAFRSEPPTSVWCLRTAIILSPIAAFFPLGGAIGSGNRGSVWGWSGATIALFMAAIGTWVNLANPPTGIGAGVLMVFLFPMAIGMAMLGAPLALLGRAVGDGS